MSDTDLRIIFDKLRQFEEELKKLEKEIEDLKPKQRYAGIDCSGHSYYVLEEGSLVDSGTAQVWYQGLAKLGDDVEG